MKNSFEWLKLYLQGQDVSNLTAESTAKVFTDTGLEVEAIEEVSSVPGGLKGLVIGEVLTKEKHPDADRLNLTTVDVGSDKPLNIVCGATNVEVGQKVVVAKVGTTIYPTNGEPFEIKKAKIRGEISEGMICAEDEIGLGEGHEGIMVLSPDAKVGTPASEYFKIESDTSFEIGLTPNRTDAVSHLGAARDLVAALNVAGKNLSIKLEEIELPKANNKLPIQVEVENSEDSPRYAGIVVSNLKVTDSPDWLKNRLTSIGLSPINNIVDITNYVMHSIGQPLHAFDYDKISGHKVVVKKANKKEKFITLDGVERELSSEDLMIYNTEKPMCMAGVFGGKDSGVSTSTKTVFIESALFNPVAIRKTSKRHGLHTDASFRYERGVDPNITITGLKMAAKLMMDIAGGEIASEIIDHYPNIIEKANVKLTYEYCNRLIGNEIPKEIIKKILAELEFEIVKEENDELDLLVPTYRVDVTRPCDVVEEIIRIYGFNNITLPEQPRFSISYSTHPDKEKVKNTISDLLVGKGLSEIMNNSLTNGKYYEEANSVNILNPISKELNVLRKSLLEGGLETARYNINRKNNDLKLFEFGKTYHQYDNYQETERLSIILTGLKQEESWKTPDSPSDFYYLKSLVNAILVKTGLSNLNVTEKELKSEIFEYGLTLKVAKKQVVDFGKISSAILKNFDIKQEVYYADFNFNTLLDLIKNTNIKYQPISKFPSVRRDLSLLLNNEISYEQLCELAKKQGKQILKEINLFDYYKGKNIDKDKKSYAMSFLFQDETKTLTDEEVDGIMKNIIDVFNKETGAELRG